MVVRGAHRTCWPLRWLIWAALGVAALWGPGAARAIVCGERILGELNPDEVDEYPFSAHAGDRVLVTWGSRGSSAISDLTLALSGPGGVPIPLQPLPTLSFKPVSFLSPPLPSTGGYVITASNPEPSQFPPDSYALTLESVTGSFAGQSNWLPSPVCGGVTDPDGKIGGTRVLRCGETFPIGTYPDHLFTLPGSSDTFTFHALEGEVVRVKADGWDPHHLLYLFDRTGELVPFTEGPFCEWRKPCTSTLPLTGVYTLAVTAAVKSAEGDYQITLESVSGSFNGGSNAAGTSPLVCGLPPDGARPLCSQPSPVGRPVRFGSIGGFGDSDAFTFRAEAGDSLSWALFTTAFPGESEARLFGPDGAAVPGPLLPSTGVYTLVVNRTDAASSCTNPCVFSVPYALTFQGSACTNACRDGVDNDADGLTDAADGGCSSVDDLSEAPDCSDGEDNDEDGLVDVEDPGCGESSSWFSGLSESPACDNGADDDGDGLVDFGGSGPTTDDPQCGGQGAWIAETVQVCGLGPELALVLAGLLGVRARRHRQRAGAA